MISIRSALIIAGLLAGASVAQACPTHAVQLAAPAAEGPDKEVKELLDTPFVKLVSITLRNGTVLPDHAAPVAVTLQAIAGAGTVKVGEEVTPLSAGHMLLIGPGAQHSVTPAGKDPLVVLVHYLKAGQGEHGKCAGHGGGQGEHAGHGAGHGGGHACAGGQCACKDGACGCKDGQCGCKDGKCAGKEGACACKGDGPCPHHAAPPSQP